MQIAFNVIGPFLIEKKVDTSIENDCVLGRPLHSLPSEEEFEIR